MDFDLKFKRLVSQSFEFSDGNDVRGVALSIWHESYVPEVNDLRGNSLNQAIYIVDKLMRFNCVGKEQKHKLKLYLKTLNRMAIYTTSAKNSVLTDKLARHYGLSFDLKLSVRDCLIYQTRHYSRKKTR